ncbi:MAG: di-trans,poly-cis-decaprenylcistransferase [Bacteroidales bacterium]|nr:di-trans,poly-cis-decaprenylcistransferase [Bacteroidales bacterium]
MGVNHVTVIMDGNGRWATSRGLERVDGHKAGTESVRAVIRASLKHGVRYLSLYAFSQENWNRPQDEVSTLMELMAQSVVNECPTFMENNIRFRVVGDRSRLSPQLLKKIEDAENLTLANDALDLIIMLSYSGRWDIRQAAERYARAIVAAQETDCDAEPPAFESFLATAGIPDPDLMIRTSGEQRISNYMLWQCAYTEFYFTPALWPDFREEEFAEALAAYEKRDRRYGKIK